MSANDFLSVHHVASELGIAEPSVRTAIRTGRLPSRKVDGAVVVTRNDVEAYRKRTQSEGSARRGRPRSASVTNHDALAGIELTDIEIKRAIIFRRLPEHVQQSLETTIQAIDALNQGGVSCSLDTVIHTGLGQIERSGGVRVFTRSDEENPIVDKVIRGMQKEF